MCLSNTEREERSYKIIFEVFTHSEIYMLYFLL